MVLHRYHQSVFALIVILSLVNVDRVQSSSARNECLGYCSSGGVCLKSNNGPKCICLPTWTGERCDISQEFTLNQLVHASQADMANIRNNLCSFVTDFCQNNGICYVNGNEFACHCRYPYLGDNCEELSECFDYCLNAGICNIESNLPVCTCMSGWTGVRCQRLQTTSTVSTPTTPSTTNLPCSYLGADYCNSGICVLVNSQARCQCPPTHTGARCQLLIQGTTSQSPSPPTSSSITPPTITSPTTALPITTSFFTSCAQNPCQRNRPCYNTGNSYYCYCGQQYTGKNCENVAK
jgi:hypothetical protein